MTQTEFEAAVTEYLEEIRQKLMLGWTLWRDSNAGVMTSEQIKKEIQSEAVDVLGWAFWIWYKQKQQYLHSI